MKKKNIPKSPNPFFKEAPPAAVADTPAIAASKPDGSDARAPAARLRKPTKGTSKQPKGVNNTGRNKYVRRKLTKKSNKPTNKTNCCHFNHRKNRSAAIPTAPTFRPAVALVGSATLWCPRQQAGPTEGREGPEAREHGRVFGQRGNAILKYIIYGKFSEPNRLMHAILVV